MHVVMQAQSSDAGVTIAFMYMSHNGFRAVEREIISADILRDICEATNWCPKPFYVWFSGSSKLTERMT